ncbi:hypothetical protein D3C73_1137400 [compost metagenome]
MWVRIKVDGFRLLPSLCQECRNIHIRWRLPAPLPDISFRMHDPAFILGASAFPAGHNTFEMIFLFGYNDLHTLFLVLFNYKRRHIKKIADFQLIGPEVPETHYPGNLDIRCSRQHIVPHNFMV